MKLKTSIPIAAIFISAIGYFVDLFDTFLLPSLRVPSLRELGVNSSESLAVYTTIMNWQLAGMAIGALFLWGPISDRRGRKTMLLASILVYSIANMLTACVQTPSQYAIARFITGIGLGGELGAGITLVAENMRSNLRGVGTMIIGGCGMLGVVFAAVLAKSELSWRADYLIGGGLGLLVLALRIGVKESDLFMANVRNKSTMKYSDILRQIVRWPTCAKYFACVMVGAPTFFVTGLLVPGAPEFGKAFGLSILPSPTTALIWTYSCISVGDILCGLMSQLLHSRKKALLTFHMITLFGIIMLLVYPPKTPEGFYYRCALAGLGIGFWANMVTNAAEQFGTNIRATVAITVPNFVRLLLFPISAAFLQLKAPHGVVAAASIVGFICSGIAILATLALPDGFAVNMDYNEPIEKGIKVPAIIDSQLQSEEEVL